MRLLVLTLFAAALLSTQQQGECAKILGIFPLNGHSHWTPMKILMEALANRGHQVTVVTHFPRKEPLKNYKEISLEGVLPQFVNSMNYSLVAQMNTVIATAFMVWSMAGKDLCPKLYETPQLQQLAASTEKFDLVITETFGTECFLGFVDKFKVPWISVTCAIPMDWIAQQVDVPTMPAYMPHMMTAYPERMNFWERTGNFLMHAFSYIGFRVASRRPSEAVMRSVFPSSSRSLAELSGTASLLLSNSHFSLTGARPGTPAHVEVGGLHITQEPTKLPEDIKSLLDSRPNIVYFSFGSMVQSETLPREALDAMLASFAKLDKKKFLVLWKANPKNFPPGLVVPENVVTRPWLPQRDVLAHPNVKVFVTHGGLLGTMEAVHCAVPMVGVPMFGDQMLNIKNYARKGIAELVYVHEVQEKFARALRNVLEDVGFKNNALKMSAQFRDRPSPPLETAIFWTEYVLRHKGGAPHLRTPARHLAWYQVWLLDVMALLAVVVSATLAVVIAACRFVCRCCKGGSSSDVDTKKKVKEN